LRKYNDWLLLVMYSDKLFKKMKIFFTIFLFMCCWCTAKSQSGIYLTSQDYKSGLLSYAEDCTTGKHIHLRDFLWNSSTIVVTKDNKKYSLKKSSIYGYKDCNNKAYRLYRNIAYYIAEPGSIYIYNIAHRYTEGKKERILISWFFSVSEESPILTLNKSNLEAVYKSNEKFEDLLDQLAKNGDVTAYDERHHMYMVNYLIYKSLHEK